MRIWASYVTNIRTTLTSYNLWIQTSRDFHEPSALLRKEVWEISSFWDGNEGSKDANKPRLGDQTWLTGYRICSTDPMTSRHNKATIRKAHMLHQCCVAHRHREGTATHQAGISHVQCKIRHVLIAIVRLKIRRAHSDTASEIPRPENSDLPNFGSQPHTIASTYKHTVRPISLSVVHWDNTSDQLLYSAHSTVWKLLKATCHLSAVVVSDRVTFDGN